MLKRNATLLFDTKDVGATGTWVTLPAHACEDVVINNTPIVNGQTARTFLYRLNGVGSGVAIGAGGVEPVPGIGDASNIQMMPLDGVAGAYVIGFKYGRNLT